MFVNASSSFHSKKSVQSTHLLDVSCRFVLGLISDESFTGVESWFRKEEKKERKKD